MRGAFTGAVGTRQGRLEQAHRGTLFLDEVGNMSLAAADEAAARAAGARIRAHRRLATVKVDVRVIAATNSDLGRMVAEGTFREDLFYRLNVIPVELPPLRDRKEDVPLLAQHFLDKFAAEVRGNGNGSAAGDTHMTLSQEAVRCLMAYAWPGNVRQMENAIERAVALSLGRSQIDATDLPAEVQQAATPAPVPDSVFPDEGLDFDAYVHNIERELIRRSLEKTRGNKGRAARLLNLKRTTLVEKLKRLERGD